MKNRKNYLKSRQTNFLWRRIGEFSDKQCPECGKPGLVYIYKHDAMACIYCNEWLEKACDDPRCSYCFTRPSTPYEVYWNEKDSPSNALARKRWRQDNYEHKKYGEKKHSNGIQK